MNIFILSMNTVLCAQYHFDKHLVKMILELTQLLSTGWHMLDPDEAEDLLANDKIYRKTHFNHPCAIWTRAHANNFYFVARLGLDLCDEWRRRFNHPPGKRHGCEDKLDFMIENLPPSIPREFGKSSGVSFSAENPYAVTLPLPQAMPDDCKTSPDRKDVNCGIAAYRKYYKSEHKQALVSWTIGPPGKKTKLDPPNWW